MEQLITGKEGNKATTDCLEPFNQQIGVFLHAFANDKGRYQSPSWGKGNPDPGITIQHQHFFYPGQMSFLFVDKTPQLVQLALGQVQVVKQVGRHGSTMPPGLIQPLTDGIFINANYSAFTSQRITLGQSAGGDGINLFLRIQIKVSWAMSGREGMITHFTQQSGHAIIITPAHQMLPKTGQTIVGTLPLGTITRRKVHS
jgi:hypothetical protein